jgi:hypothetical protein
MTDDFVNDDFFLNRTKMYSKPPKNIEELFSRPKDIQIFRDYVNSKNEFQLYVPLFLKIKNYELLHEDKQKEDYFYSIKEEYLLKMDLEGVTKISLDTEKTMEDKTKILKDISDEIFTVLRYLFSKFKKTDQWILHVGSTYTLELDSLFEEDFEIFPKRRLKINDVELIRIQNIESKNYYFTRKFEGNASTISKIRKDFNSIYSRFHLNNHPNILHIIKKYEEESQYNEMTNLYYVIREITNDLSTYIEMNDIATISSIELIQYAYKLVAGLNFLHENDFYFSPGDLHDRRIFFDQYGTNLLIDLGIVVERESNPELFLNPPEFDPEVPYSQKYDIFSMGLILFRLVTGIVKSIFIYSSPMKA